MTVISGRIVTPDAVIDGWVLVEGDTIAAVSTGAPPAGDHVDTGERLVFPGFVDVHNHGGGGHSIPGGTTDDIVAAAAFHRSHGTTTMLGSLVSAPPADLLEWTARVAAVCDEADTLEGVHLEGPFLAERRCGAHNPAHLLEPDPELFDALLAAGDGHVRAITIAPELAHADEVIARAVRAGVRVAIGHTDADHRTAVHALDVGASVGTHLFNAMSPALHRHPGVVGALLDHPTAVLELIADGVHVHPAMVRLAWRAAGDRIALITDAIAAAGMPDGPFRLGPIEIVVADGVARLAGGGSLAGSTLTMDRAVCNVLAQGVPPEEAARAAAWVPARLLGIEHRAGALVAGQRADIVVLDPEAGATTVMSGGTWVVPPEER